MHRIIQNHLRRFSNLFGYSETEESEQFELFVNYCVTASLAAGRFEPKEVTTGSDDSGIDGVVVVIDDEVVTSKELAEALFQKERRHRDVSLAFTQSKSGDAFTKADILSFGAAVCNFLDDEPCFPRGDLEDTMREVFDVVIANVHKVRGGKPNCHLYFATTGMWPGADEIITGAANKIRADVAASDYFSDVAFTPLGRDSLLRLWTETYEPVEATFQVKGYTPFPAMNGVNQAYMAVVPARSFIENVLDGGDGRIRASVFQENVRSYLGDENAVNSRITGTISGGDTRDRFAVLNNGVTIVAPEVRIQSDQVHIRNFQIVNGCQTSHVLFQSRDIVDDTVMIPMKIIQSDDPTVVAQIVEATNSQTQIDQTQFLSLRSKVREIEEYFKTFDEDDAGKRLYLERRERQYAGQDIPNARIIDIETLARAFSAMFLDLPHMAARYPRRLLEQQAEEIFQESHLAEAYYAAAFTHYRMQSLFSNRVLPGNFYKYKWHLLTAVKYLIVGDTVPKVNSRKIREVAKKIVDAIRQVGASSPGAFSDCVEIFHKLGDPTRDRVKGQAFVGELRVELSRWRARAKK